MLCTFVLASLLSLNAIAADRAALITAARSSDTAALRDLIRSGRDINAAEPDGATALHWISYHDDIDSARALIRAGADVNAANDLGVTPLWNACLNRSAEMVRLLLASGGNPNASLLSGETPLMVAARSGSADIVEQLARKGANLNARGTRAQTALMWAAAQRHPDVVKVLVARGADIHARSEVWSQVMAVPPHGYRDYNRAIPHGGDTALMFAARVGDLPSIRVLVDAGANVNDQDAWGVSASVLAAHSGFTDIVEYLLDHGADPNHAAAGFSALHIAIMRRNETMAAALLAHGADPNLPLQTWTPTRRSSQDYNFPPALVGATPFWLAARCAHPGIMRLLLKHGADPRIVHRSEYIAGERFQKKTEVTNALMAATGMGGGSPWVPLPKSEAEASTLEAVRLVLELGIDPNARNTDGRTALDAANGLHYESVVGLLRQAGAIPGSPKPAESSR